MPNIFALLRKKEETKKEINKYLKEHDSDFNITKEQIEKSKFPERYCAICERNGCDRFEKHMDSYFHEKCYKLVTDITFKNFK